MNRLDDDIARGCLENGEQIEALWGAGWWSGRNQQNDIEWSGGECPRCHKEAHYGNGQFCECEECGLKASELEAWLKEQEAENNLLSDKEKEEVEK